MHKAQIIKLRSGWIQPRCLCGYRGLERPRDARQQAIRDIVRHNHSDAITAMKRGK